MRNMPIRELRLCRDAASGAPRAAHLADAPVWDHSSRAHRVLVGVSEVLDMRRRAFCWSRGQVDPCWQRHSWHAARAAGACPDRRRRLCGSHRCGRAYPRLLVYCSRGGWHVPRKLRGLVLVATPFLAGLVFTLLAPRPVFKRGVVFAAALAVPLRRSRSSSSTGTTVPTWAQRPWRSSGPGHCVPW